MREDQTALDAVTVRVSLPKNNGAVSLFLTMKNGRRAPLRIPRTAAGNSAALSRA
jgi:hypothetical protein